MVEELSPVKRPLKTYLVAGFGFLILAGYILGSSSQMAVKGASTVASPTPTVATVAPTNTISTPTVTPQISLKPSTTVAPTIAPTVMPTTQPPTVTPTVKPPNAAPTVFRAVAAPTAAEVELDQPTAQCRDGSFSYSLHRQGTCSHHGGVAQWL